MDESSKEVIEEKQSTSKKPISKPEKTRKRPNKKAKGQKDIRTLIKSKKNELLTYSKDFDFICKQSGIDVDPEQLQLAIALSKSLEDHKSTDDAPNTEKSLNCNQRRSKIRTTLQEYGFQTKTAPVKKVKRYRKHYNLILVADTEKQQKIADKYAEILIKNACLTKVNESVGKNSTDSYLYNLSTNVSYEHIRNDEIFYIKHLVSRSLHEHQFKDWSKIPGRPVSPKLETPNHFFKDIECSQEELDNILSGSTDLAQDIVKSNHRNRIIISKPEDTSLSEPEINQGNTNEPESKDNLTEVLCDNRVIEDDLISRTINISNNSAPIMSPPNRSCSPDLFDDEVTIIMDSSIDNIPVPDKNSERTITVNDQHDFMELTDCIGINGNNTDSKHIACFSQGSNKTVSNSNDFMDLTECIPAYSQNKSHNSQYTRSYANNDKKTTSVIKDNNQIEVVDLNKPQNVYNNKETSSKDEKSLDDTIIMIDEDYRNINTGNKINAANATSKENLIDLVHNQYENSKVLNRIQAKHNDSIINLDESPDANNDSHSEKDYQLSNNKTISDLPVNMTSKKHRENLKDIENEDMVDLTQPSNFENCLSPVIDNCPIETYDNNTECNIISNNASHCENTDYDKIDNIDETEKDENERPEKCDKFEQMDLTQSSNSEDCIQEVGHEVSVSNRSLEDTIIHNEHDKLINLVHNDLKRNDDVIQDNLHRNYLDIDSKTIQETEQKKSTENNIVTIFDTDHDFEFDNLIKKLSKSRSNVSDGNASNSSVKSTSENNPDIEEIDLTQNYDRFSCNLSGRNNLSDKSGNIDHNAHSDIMNDQGSDIDLTQQSDSSENRSCSPNIIEVPCDLGKRDNISIDYDEVCEINITKDNEATSSADNKYGENKNSLKEDVSNSSQQSEVFELSDTEFNYSVHQHKQDNESSILKQTKFDIGGLSVIEDFLNRKSLPRRSELRCSCSSNFQPNTKETEVESCLPVVNNIENASSYNKGKSCEEIKLVKVSTPLKSRSEDNILIAKTPKHNDYIIKTDQVTPMPNYEAMCSPERNEELDKFGIKPLKRKRAIQILTHIYNQTHPIMEVIPDECSSPSKIRRKNNESFPRRVIASQIDYLVETQSVKSSNDGQVLEPNLSQKTSKGHKNLSKEKKSPTDNSSKENILYEETTTVPDIRNIECSEEDWVFQKREKAKVHSCRVPLHIAFHNYVTSRKRLREAILKYEPINIDDIHKGLTATGYRYNPKDLLKFMDRKCITVKTADNTRKNKNQ